MLTLTKDEIENSVYRNSDLKKTALELYAKLAKAEAELERMQQWINDLQSGMYINCVYCGHRYGPRKNTPVAMADVLKEHIEQCPKHPLSHERELRQIAIDYYEKRIEGIAARNGKDFALEALKTLQEMTNSYNAENPWLGITVSIALLLNEKEKVQAELAELKADVALLLDQKEDYIEKLFNENESLKAELAECNKQRKLDYEKGKFDGYHSGLKVPINGSEPAAD